MTKDNEITALGEFNKKFENTYELFKKNLENDEEVGASFAVYQNGEVLVNLYGGYRDRDKKNKWDQNTIVNIHSTSKGIVAMIVAKLIDENKLDLEKNVADYWPEFANGGKESIKVKTLLSHQAGMYGWRQPIDETDFYKWDYVVDLLANQEPYHKADEKICYHPKTIGFLVGELIKRVTNKSVGKNLEELLNSPLETKCFIGTPSAYHDNIAELISSESLRKAFSDPTNVDEYLITAFLNPANRTKTANTAEWRLAEIPAMNCHSNSGSLAKIYDFFLSHLSNKFISSNTFETLTTVAVSGDDHVMKSPMQWSHAGYSVGGGKLFGKSNKAFGHTGWGGSMAFGDPENGISCAYTMNLLTGSMLGDQRALKLVETIYDAL
mgnify:FL=1